MNKLNIALLTGGNSSEREIALKSAVTVSAALDRNKFNVYVVDVDMNRWIYRDEKAQDYRVDLNDLSLTLDTERVKFDFALIIIHGTPGEDGIIQGYLEMMGLPFSSCSMTSSVLTFDKVTTKRMLANTGVKMAKDLAFSKGEDIDVEAVIAELGLPLFVKPNASGSSCGVSKVSDVDQLPAAIDYAFSEGDTILLEEAIVGREVSCGIFIPRTPNAQPLLLPITEMRTSRDFFDYEAKYTTGLTEEITPAPIPNEWLEKIDEARVKAYKSCRCSGIVRVDFIIDERGEPYLIEINTIPGFSDNSLIPQQARAAGMTVGELFELVILDSLGD